MAKSMGKKVQYVVLTISKKMEITTSSQVVDLEEE
jgi:hypothetical protein